MIENTILAHLLTNETYARKVLPFIKLEYFQDNSHKLIYKTVASYLEKYNVLPSKEAVVIDLNKVNGLSSDMHETTQAKVNGLQADVLTDMVWLVDQTEKYCQDRAVYNAIMESITIIDGKTSDKDKGAIPQILSEALAVSFDNSVGHDFLQDTESRYEFYHRKEEKIAFDLDYFNKITRGGLPRKSLNVALAGTGVGKTLFMCHAAAANLTTGYNVLYITMEMSEERIAERIDANLLNVTVDELKILPKDVYEKKMDRLRSKCKGRLIVKEYPTSSAGSGNFRHLLQELKQEEVCS